MMCVEQESESRLLNRFGASPKSQQSRMWLKERKKAKSRMFVSRCVRVWPSWNVVKRQDENPPVLSW